MKGKLRLFIGIPIDDNLKLEFENFQHHQKDIVGLRWISPEFFHLTLCFMGSVWEKELSTIEKKIKKKSSTFSPFSLNFSSIDLFPKKKPRLILANYESNNIFNELKEELHNSLLEERPDNANPHITLGRYKKKQYGLLKRLNLDFTPLETQVYASRIVLWESETKPTGAEYQLINEFELR